jgi:phytol kinase
LLAVLVPAPGTALVVAPLALAYGAAAGWLVRYLHGRHGVRTPYTRKIFHFAIFTMAGAVHLLWGAGGVVVFGSAIMLLVPLAVLRGAGDPFYEAIARPADAPHRTLLVLVPAAATAAGGVLSSVLFPAFAVVGYLVCGWGDAAGEPVGTRWGRHRYRVPSLGGVPATRSLEGSVAVFLAGALGAFLGLLAMGLPAGSALLPGLAAGLAGALAEAVSNRGLDNFTVQVAATVVAGVLAGPVLTP